jgi:hypothetical protein
MTEPRLAGIELIIPQIIQLIIRFPKSFQGLTLWALESRTDISQSNFNFESGTLPDLSSSSIEISSMRSL